MLNQSPLVLIVDDDEKIQRLFEESLAEKVIILPATFVELALNMFKDWQSKIDAIVIDACVPGNEPNTQPLVKKFREKGFLGPIIGTSSCEEYRQELMQCGCSHQAEKDKVPALLLELLKIK